MHSQPRPFTFDRVVRLLIGCAIFAFVIWLIGLLKDVLLPFCVACLVAYLFEPFVQYNRTLLRLKGRIPAVFVTLFEALLFFGILAYFCVPSIIGEFHRIGSIFDRYASSQMPIQFVPEELHQFLRRYIDFDQLAKTMLQQDFDTIIDRFIPVITGGWSVILGIVSWLMGILYTIFIMLDYDRLMHGFKLMVPPRFRNICYKLGNDIKESMNHYFRGQALIACFVAAIYAVGFSLCDLPLALILGLSAGVLFMIPYCQFIILIPMTLLCLLDAAVGTHDFWTQFGSCIAVVVVVQIVADLFLTPKIMGKAMGLNPAIILLSLSIWGSLFGMIGMIIALPLTTLFLSYYDQYIIRGDNGLPPAARAEAARDLRDIVEK